MGLGNKRIKQSQIQRERKREKGGMEVEFDEAKARGASEVEMESSNQVQACTKGCEQMIVGMRNMKSKRGSFVYISSE